MDISVFSLNPEVSQHLMGEFLETEHCIQSYSSMSELQSTLESKTSILLIYHLGLRQNDESDFASLQTLFKEKLNTLVLTNTPSSEQGIRMLNLNVRGYANTYLEQDKLIMALSVIEKGEIWAGASLIQYMLNHSTHETENQLISLDSKQGFYQLLTSREQEIAQKILTGLQNKLIADELHITERTVKAHLSTIYKKLDVRNRLELTIKLQKANRRSLT